MSAPRFQPGTVKDAALALSDAVDRLRVTRTEADLLVAALEARWAANRAARTR
jgi:hypothetical protein